ncbi:hypothetical protein [Sulfobacillus harzensis]|uniref:Uncharacterized protein n=1 Tax=Sulfobacillus harzensis TaxID=2729629 RepID=A0A7Y0L102_9FIRM|nr:hypothetical protein [Sulfobacillus harzensis]NMP20992.1 hypothetical protein [Sulfobacillus harzensis]
MTATYQQYREILERVPHIQREEIVEDGAGGLRVQVLSHSSQSPRHVVREIVSLLRTAGWHDIKTDDIVMVQIQQDTEQPKALGRLRIAGFAVTFGEAGYEATCRLVHGEHEFHGRGVAPDSVQAVAMATLQAVNVALGQKSGLKLVHAEQMSVAGVDLSLALVKDDEDVTAGNAVRRESAPEETMMRAVLDAINRRFVLYTGQKV